MTGTPYIEAADPATAYVSYGAISDACLAAFILDQVDPGAVPEGDMLAVSRVIGPDDTIAALVFVCLSATRHRPAYLIVHLRWPALTGQMLISDGRELVLLPARSDGYEFIRRFLVQEGYLEMVDSDALPHVESL